MLYVFVYPSNAFFVIAWRISAGSDLKKLKLFLYFLDFY